MCDSIWGLSVNGKTDLNQYFTRSLEMKGLAIFGGIVGLGVLLVFSSIFNGYALSVLWGWFVVPTFGRSATWRGSSHWTGHGGELSNLPNPAGLPEGEERL